MQGQSGIPSFKKHFADAYTLHVHTASDGLGYILHVNTASGGKGYTLQVRILTGGKGYVHTAGVVGGERDVRPNCRYWKEMHLACP
jgi:hypothetical protein